MEGENENKKNLKNKNIVSFKTYISKLLKNKDDTYSFSKESLIMLDYIVLNIGHTMVNKLHILKKHTKNKTISISDFEALLGIILGFEAGKKIVIICNSFIEIYEDFLTKKEELKELSLENGGNLQKNHTQQNVKAGLNFSVSRVQKIFMINTSRVSHNGMIFFTAILETIINMILDNTIENLKINKKHRITTQYLIKSIQGLEDLKPFTKNYYYNV